MATTERTHQKNGKVALVTGVNRGIGLEIARQFAGHAHHVIVGSRNKASGESAAAGLEKLGHSSSAVELDVADTGSVQRAVQQVIEDIGRIDVLVNNAGIAIDGPDHRPSDPDFEKIKQLWTPTCWVHGPARRLSCRTCPRQAMGGS